MNDPGIPTTALITQGGLGVVCLVLLYLFVWAVRRAQASNDATTAALKDAATKMEALLEKVVTVQTRSDARGEANTTAMQALERGLSQYTQSVQIAMATRGIHGRGTPQPFAAVLKKDPGDGSP